MYKIVALLLEFSPQNARISYKFYLEQNISFVHLKYA